MDFNLISDNIITDEKNENLIELASKVEKLKYEILHGCFDDDSEINNLKLKIEKIEDLIKNDQCKQLCLTELTDDEKTIILDNKI